MAAFYADFQEAFLIVLGQPLRDLASLWLAGCLVLTFLNPILEFIRRMFRHARKTI